MRDSLAKKILSGLGRVVYLDLKRPSDRAKLQDAEAYFTGTFMLRLLPSFSSNLGKRLVKALKVYSRDSGLLHTLLGLEKWKIYSHTLPMVHHGRGMRWRQSFLLSTILKILLVK